MIKAVVEIIQQDTATTTNVQILALIKATRKGRNAYPLGVKTNG